MSVWERERESTGVSFKDSITACYKFSAVCVLCKINLFRVHDFG